MNFTKTIESVIQKINFLFNTSTAHSITEHKNASTNTSVGSVKEYTNNSAIRPMIKHTEIFVPERLEDEPKFLSSCKTIPAQTNYIAYYKNGKLYDVEPRNKKIPLYEERQTAYDARYIVSDGVKYDLEDAKSIESIAVPNFSETHGISSPTNDLSYILKIRLRGENRPHLAVPLAYKVANLMIASSIGWRKKDYYRLVIQLWSIGETKYGDYLLEELKTHLPLVAAYDELEYIRKESFDYNMKLANELNEDYVISICSLCSCEKCAPYRSRVYNISGKDKRFPKLSDYVTNAADFCCLHFSGFSYYNGRTYTIYYYDKNGTVKEKEVDAIKYSNRPFIDDRCDIEKSNYEEHKLKKNESKEYDERYYDREYWINKYMQHLEYQNIVDLLGDKAPKSYSGYMRMKKNNTSNFQKILQVTQENNIKIN